MEGALRRVINEKNEIERGQEGVTVNQEAAT